MGSPSNYHIRLKSSARTDRGMQRPHNEDSVHLWSEEQHMLAVIADGMGGAVAGEEASRIAIETISQRFSLALRQNPTDYDALTESALAEQLRGAVREANQNIINKSIRLPELKGMGTTLTMAFARGGAVTLAHVGDSRAYLIDAHDNSIHQLTADHSFVQALVDAGHITADEADQHPMRNVLYRALGQSSDLDVDVVHDVHLNVGDRLILCSDGLTLHVRPFEIADIVLSNENPEIASQALIRLANERGGKDNISVVVVLATAEANKQRHSADSEYDLETLDYEDDDPTRPSNTQYRSRPSQSYYGGAYSGF